MRHYSWDRLGCMKSFLLGLSLAVAVAGCGGGGGGATATGDVTQIIRVDGSSTVYPITEAVAEEFRREHPSDVTVGISGTGGGFQKFCRDEIDIAGRLRQSGDRIHRAADRVRWAGGRGQPEEHVGGVDHGCRAQEALGASRARHDHAVEPGPAGLARSRDPSIRRRRRFRHVRLLHRGDRR